MLRRRTMQSVFRTLLLTALVFAIYILAFSSNASAQFTVSGTVQNSLAAPVPNVKVSLYDNLGNPIGIPLTLTDASGFYSITGLPNGSYQLRFVPLASTGLLHQWTSFSIAGMNQTVNVTLLDGVIISGFMTDTNGVGIPNLDVNVTDRNTGNVIETPGDNSDLTGFYDIVVPAGRYDIRYRPVMGEPLIPVDIIDVDIVNDTTINVVMQTAIILSGTVTDINGLPVFDADLDVFDVTTGNKLVTPGDNTDISGNFNITVPPGIYDIDVDPAPGDGLAPAIKTNVTVTSNTIVNFQLQPGAIISGFVRNNFQVGISGTDLDLTDESSGADVYLITDKTDATGFYSMSAPLGTFSVDFQPPLSTKLAPVRMTGIVVSGNLTLNATLQDGLSLTGVVRNGSGAPINNVDLDAKTSPVEVVVPLLGDHTDPAGAFSTVIAPGAYDLEFEPPAGINLAPLKLYGVTLNVDTALSIVLDTGMVVSGIVRDTDNTVFPDVRVTAITEPAGDTAFIPTDKSDLSGNYLAKLSPNTYTLIFKPDSTLGRTDSVVFQGVAITKDTTIDVTFSAGPATFTISGTVTDPLTSPVANVDITLKDNAGVPIQTYVNATNASGFYSIPGVTAGTYQLTFDPEPGSGLLSKTQTGIAVSSNTVVDITLDAVSSHTISGTVTDQSLVGVENVDINLLSSIGVPINSYPNATDALGQYSLPGIPDNTYWMQFVPSPLTGLDQKIITNVVVNADIVVDVILDPCPGSCGCCDLAGDADNSGTVNIADVTFLITRIFSGGAAPACNDEADADGSNAVNIADVTYLISRIFSGGPAPICGTTGS